jgi:hypothetical protein
MGAPPDRAMGLPMLGSSFCFIEDSQTCTAALRHQVLTTGHNIWSLASSTVRGSGLSSTERSRCQIHRAVPWGATLTSSWLAGLRSESH